jgi:serine/threonine protein kinase
MKETQVVAPFSSIKIVKEKCENHFTEERTVSFSPSSGEQPVSLSTSQNDDTEENVTQQDPLKKIQSDAPVSSIKIVKPKGDNHYRQEGAVKRGKWKLGAKIGVGSFGQVHVGMNTQTGTLMAVKVFKMKGAIMKDIRTEVELMRSLKHVNIVRYLGAQMDKELLHIFQEWVPGGAVSCLLNKFGPFSIEVIQSYISQTICGLSFLHDNDIMHRDIKGSNILVNDEGVVKLADFGASKKLKNLGDNMMMSLTVRGTPYFMSPEVFEEKYSAKADIWGIGCVAFQMAMAMPPWKDKGFTNPISLFNYIKKQKGSPPMDHPMKESFSKRQQISWNLFEKFVNRCFQQDLSKRPDTKQLANDPFFLTLCEDDGDDESIQYRGLFSPGHDIVKDYGSPKKLYSPAKLPSPAGRSLRTKSAHFLSPSRSKTNAERRSPSIYECGTPPKQKKIQKSPSPDTREWPGWATDQLKQQNNCKERGSENINEPKSSTMGTFTGFSNLAGLEFLENSKTTKL